MSGEESSSDLTETEVFIIGGVCAAILIVLLSILVVIIYRRRQRKNNYVQDPHSPRTVQQGNGSIPTAKPLGFENQVGMPQQIDNRNGYPAQYLHHPRDHLGHNTSYDSHTIDKQYEYEMNRRNANISGDTYYTEKAADMSFNTSHSPRTPTKDPQQFIHVPEDPKREGSSVGSHESGYSTPDVVKPKKVIYEVVV